MGGLIENLDRFKVSVSKYLFSPSRSPYHRNVGPDSHLFRRFKEGVDSVWLLGTDSMQAIDIFKEVGFPFRLYHGYCVWVGSLCGRVWLVASMALTS